MKTLEVTLYQFEELSDEAKQRAVDNWNSSEVDSFSIDEIVKSLEEFADIFKIKIQDYSLGDRSDISYRLDLTDDVLELSGVRLLAYIVNNYYGLLQEMKPFGKYPYKRCSRIIEIQNTCPFTGVCWYEDIIAPIREFIKRPDNRTFEDLLSECISACEQAAQNAVEYERSFEYVSETLIANEYDFTISGERY